MTLCMTFEELKDISKLKNQFWTCLDIFLNVLYLVIRVLKEKWSKVAFLESCSTRRNENHTKHALTFYQTTL